MPLRDNIEIGDLEMIRSMIDQAISSKDEKWLRRSIKFIDSRIEIIENLASKDK